MKITSIQQDMLNGKNGKVVQKSMQILAALGKIYGAESLIPVKSVQIAGVSYSNLGDAGLEFLEEMASDGAKTKVLTTLNPAGMDIENWEALKIEEDFVQKQKAVLSCFERLGVFPTCTCTPYLIGNSPIFKSHIAWSESSAVCYANSVIGARSNREGGPSALAASLTGFTPAYGYHLDENRQPTITVELDCKVNGTFQYGALGKLIGEFLEQQKGAPIPYIQGLPQFSLEEIKSFCASIATYGGTALFHAEGLTPEYKDVHIPKDIIRFNQEHLDQSIRSLSSTYKKPDFISLGCPHLSISEIQYIAEKLNGKSVKTTFWLTTSRQVKQLADRVGFTKIIEDSGAVIAADTCCVVAPIKGRFRTMLTDSAKACYYAYAKNNFETRFASFDDVLQEAVE